MSLHALLVATSLALVIGGHPVGPRGRTLLALTPSLVAPDASIVDANATFKPKSAGVTVTAKLPVTPDDVEDGVNTTFNPKPTAAAPKASIIAAAAEFNPELSVHDILANLLNAKDIANPAFKPEPSTVANANHTLMPKPTNHTLMFKPTNHTLMPEPTNHTLMPKPTLPNSSVNLSVVPNVSIDAFVPKPLVATVITNLSAEVDPNVSVNDENFSGSRNLSDYVASAARNALRAQKHLKDVKRAVEVTLNGTRISVASGRKIEEAASNITELYSGTTLQQISMLVMVTTALVFTAVLGEDR